MNNQDQIIKTKDGREIQIMQDGDLDGIPVVVHHGSPGSRTLESIEIADAAEQGYSADRF